MFKKILGKLEDFVLHYWDDEDEDEAMVSNCIIKGRNVSSYLLNKPFEYFRVLRFDGWQDL